MGQEIGCKDFDVVERALNRMKQLRVLRHLVDERDE
jgi:hypothetical protein